MSSHTAEISPTLTRPTPPTVRANGLSDVVSDSLLIAWRSLKKIPRSPDWLIAATVQPIMFTLLFRYIFAGAIQSSLPVGVSAVNYLIAGIVAQSVVFNTMATGIGLTEDLQKGLMDRFRALPMTRSSVIVGRVLADVVLNAFVTMIGILAGLAAGFRPNGGAAEWSMTIALLVLTSLAFSWMMAFTGLSLKTVEAVNSVGFLWVFPLTFVSSAFVPTSTLPGWLRVFAENQPFTLLVNAVRGWLTGYPEVGNQGWLAAIWMVGVMVVFIPLSVWQYQRRTTR
ncbi:MAG: ABC transporter permease [Chloroflexia bacterium]|nr:ABC transporter permease [Chloroflexia bacterium]